MEEVLSQIGEVLSFVFGGIGRAIERGITGLFGSSNARYLKKLQPIVAAINALEPRYQAMTDAELREQTVKFRKRLAAGETLDDLLTEAFAVCREASRRVIGLRHYDVQLMGGIVLHRGNIAEMVTGEGKTLVATLPAYLNALEGKGVHVVTVNDYLARRDMEWMGPIYMSLGLTVGTIQADMPTEDRQKAYDCDITYGTNNEFGFDYLRDNMRPAAKGDENYEKFYQQSQGPLHFAIIDEVDNILIDEARTPLIISGPAHDDVTRYAKADRIARQLKKGTHFEVNEKEHSAHLTDEGVRAAEQLAGVESFYTAGHMEWPHLIDNALKAHHLYKRDVNYVVNGDEVVIVDEFTGRLMPGRNWSDGLHQAVEAKEAGAGVRIKEENQTLATITLQNFFKLYKKICGMTGTAMTEAGEFWKIYKLDVIAIPTNRPLQRVNNADVIYRTEKEKFGAIADEIERMHKWDVLVNDKGEEYLGRIIHETDGTIEFQPRDSKDRETIQKKAVKEIDHRGRPVLVGTVSIERSELISHLLEKRGIPHEVLNAKHHQREAEIVAQAGRLGAVTIATNMAGRGTDIILGGNPEAMAWAKLQEKYPTRLEVPQEEWDSLVREIEGREQMKAEGRMVASMGGLHILGTERHEARRIDLQLRGRCGRQGDPGSSRFYLSLEDDLMRIFAGEWVKNILTRLGMKEGEAIESHMVSRRIEGAQKKVEERNFEVRKNLLEYDEVMDEQRKRVYSYRQDILNGANCKLLILEMINQQIDHYLSQFLDKDYGAETFAEWATKLMSVELPPRDFRGTDFHGAEIQARDQAERMAEGQVLEALEENLPEGEDTSEWNWEALAKTVNTRWHLSLRDRDLRQLGRDQVGEFLIERARAAIQKIDLSEGARFLEPDFGIQTACNWVKHKFGVDLSPDQVRSLEPEAFKKVVQEKARAMYEDKEAEFPVMAGLYHFATRDSAGHKHYDRDGLAEWAAERFHVELGVEDLKNKQRDEIRAILVEQSRQFSKGQTPAAEEAHAWLDRIISPDAPIERSLRAAYEDGRLRELSDWLK
ncbi:MAG: preprotein translocase subunit SecA, partial [Thermoguttaceae bacterium]